MNFVRGESTDYATKGEKYKWSAAPPPGMSRKRGRKPTAGDNSDDSLDNAYFEEDDEPSKESQITNEEEDPLDAFMAELEKPGPTRKAAAGPSKVPRFASKPPVAAKSTEPASELDPLDAFMAGLASAPTSSAAPRMGKRAVKACDEEDDPVASYMEDADRKREEEEALGASDDDTSTAKGARRQLKGQKGGAVGSELEAIDHEEIEYEPFERELYAPHPTIRALSDDDVRAHRASINLSVSGFDVPAPIRLFEHAGLSRELMSAIRRLGYESPTPIQQQALPVALSGRDVIGVASTGSGKTCAYLLPMVTQIMTQRELSKGEGPIGLVIAPTHELAEQIVVEARRLSKGHGLRCTGVFGGVGKYEQFKELKAGSEVVVGTPGRLIELVGMKGGLSMRRVTYVVLDEADRMFSLGFESQVRALLGQVRPDRQTLLFSATFKPALEQLARDVLREPVRVAIGKAGDASEDVTQVIEVVDNESLKWGWLCARLEHFMAQGTVLVFVSTRAAAEELAAKLSSHMGRRVGSIHGERSQGERQEILHAFKRGVSPVLVATDVASRGLDLPAIKTVVNFEVARRLDDHTHRIGRTGRAGADGAAYTLLTTGEADAAVDMVRSLRSARQVASAELLRLASRSRRWASSGLSEASGGHPSHSNGQAGRGGSHGGAISSAPNEFAPPQQHNLAKMQHAAQTSNNPLAIAQACAARLSAELTSSAASAPPPPPIPPFTPSATTRPPPPPPSQLPVHPAAMMPPSSALVDTSAAAAARAAAQAVAARLAASQANPAPPLQPPPPPPARPNRWS